MIQLSLLIDVVSLALIYVTFLYPKWKDNPFLLFNKTAIFIYLSCVAYFTLVIPFFIPLPFINTTFSSFNINLIPFNDIIQAYDGAITQVLMNILLFIPFGILYPFIYKQDLKKTMIVSLLLTLLIETFQLFSVRQLSSFDITDILMNLLGAFIGFILFKLFYKTAIKLITRFFPNKQNNIKPTKQKLNPNMIKGLIIIQVLLKSVFFNFI